MVPSNLSVCLSIFFYIRAMSLSSLCSDRVPSLRDLSVPGAQGWAGPPLRRQRCPLSGKKTPQL